MIAINDTGSQAVKFQERENRKVFFVFNVIMISMIALAVFMLGWLLLQPDSDIAFWCTLIFYISVPSIWSKTMNWSGRRYREIAQEANQILEKGQWEDITLPMDLN